MKAKQQVIILWVAVVLLGGWLLVEHFGVLEMLKLRSGQTETTHDVVLEEVQALGKLELVKYRLKDVVEHKKSNRFLPDAKVLLVVAGEVVGCVDLTKIKSESILRQGDSILVHMPAPEICYSKIDHQNSKVYDTEYTIISGEANKMIAEALREAEAELEQTVLKQGILEETKKNAELLLRPMLERLTEKTVILHFPTEN